MRKPTVENLLNIIDSLGGVDIMDKQQDISLMEHGMDSLKFIQMIVTIEERLECEIPDSKLVLSEMETVEKIMTVLNELYEENRLPNIG